MLAARPAGAQAATGQPTEDAYAICYRFAFGAWTPKLDLAAAGHDPAAKGGPGAPGGRDWATDDKTSAADGILLFPAWWPPGVRVRFEGPPPAVGDSVRGTAYAFVADAGVRAPTAPIRAWGVRCGEPLPSQAAPPRPAR